MFPYRGEKTSNESQQISDALHARSSDLNACKRYREKQGNPTRVLKTRTGVTRRGKSFTVRQRGRVDWLITRMCVIADSRVRAFLYLPNTRLKPAVGFRRAGKQYRFSPIKPCSARLPSIVLSTGPCGVKKSSSQFQRLNSRLSRTVNGIVLTFSITIMTLTTPTFQYRSVSSWNYKHTNRWYAHVLLIVIHCSTRSAREKTI